MDLSKYHQPYANITDSKIGVLVIHGLTSTTSSMLGLAQKFAEAGFNVELPKLSGHGTKWQDLNKVSYLDWINDLEIGLEKLKKRAEKIFVCGLSLGGGLSLYLAGKHPELSGLILINNACVFTSPAFWFIPILKRITPSTKAVGSDINEPNEKEIAYDRTPTAAVHEMLKMLKIMRSMLKDIKQPAIIFKSKQDHVIPIKSAIYTYNNLGGDDIELVWLEKSYHVAPMDYDKELISQKSIEFIRNHS